MYKHKLFASHPRHLLKSKGTFKTHSKSHKSGSSSIDDYLLSLVNGVRHGIKISKTQKHNGAGALKKNYSGGRCCGSGKTGLKFIR